MPTLQDEIAAEIKALKEKQARLEKADVAKLEAEKQKCQDRIDEIEKELSQLRRDLGLKDPKKSGTSKTAKDEGKPVSVAALTKHLNGIKDPKDRNCRRIAKALDTTAAQVLKTARGNEEAFTVSGKTPQFSVTVRK